MYEDRKSTWYQNQLNLLLDKRDQINVEIKNLTEYPFAHIQDLLKPGAVATGEDVKTFNDYDNEDISLKECIEQFMHNNGISERRRTFEDSEFELWLRSLGYGVHRDQV